MRDKPDLQLLEEIEIRKPWLLLNNHRIKHPFGEAVAALAMIECISRLFELGHIAFYNHILALITFAWSLYEPLLVNIYYTRSDERGLTVYRIQSISPAISQVGQYKDRYNQNQYGSARGMQIYR